MRIDGLASLASSSNTLVASFVMLAFIAPLLRLSVANSVDMIVVSKSQLVVET